MSKIYKMATAMAVTLIVMAAPAAATGPQRASSSYCLSYGEGGTDCSFTSKAQCEATASGHQEAACYRNVFGDQWELDS